MKNRVFIVILGIGASGVSLAQNWCTPGASWWHDHWGMFGNQVGVVQVQCAGDTIILGETVHRATASATGYDFLANMPYQFALGDIVTRSTMDQVSYWDGTQWHLLFDLSVGVGGQWIVSGYNFSNRIVEVSGAGLMTIGGMQLRYSVVTFDPPFQGLTAIAGDTIIERMGYKRLFIDPNRTVGMDGDVYDVRCYQDDDLFYTTLGGNDCDLQTGVFEGPSIEQVSLAPNPNNGVFTLNYSARSNAGLLEIRDVAGRLVFVRTIANMSGPVAVDLSSHKKGLYLVHVLYDDGTCARERLVKE
ncbi:MAG TPA: T9SS type A sorting domain-containing protein [Flavobacteriales bacterium]|nr:T9SS type A sorting domain-containing protein [Flavobacteriales bacterium]HNK68575.1 T9SS type A sorting domain-containing protein [Flavobacteriales bacterium]